MLEVIVVKNAVRNVMADHIYLTSKKGLKMIIIRKTLKQLQRKKENTVPKMDFAIYVALQ